MILEKVSVEDRGKYFKKISFIHSSIYSIEIHQVFIVCSHDSQSSIALIFHLFDIPLIVLFANPSIH